MKKEKLKSFILVGGIIVAMLLTGCKKEIAEAESALTEVSESESETKLEEETEMKTELETVKNVDLDKGLQISKENIWETVNGVAEFSPLVEGDTTDAWKFDYISAVVSPIDVFLYYRVDSEFPSAVVVVPRMKVANSTIQNYLDKIKENISLLLETDILELTDIVSYEEDGIEITTIVFNGDFEYQNLPTSLRDAAISNFFDSEERTALYNQYYKAGQYAELNVLLDQYIESENPTASDPVYITKGILEPILPILDNIMNVYDEVEGKSKIYFNGVHEITNEICLLPSKEGESKGFDITIGFRNPDWIFFNRVVIRLENDETISETYKSYDVNTEILSGEILEAVTVSQINSAKMSEFHPTMIKFENTQTGATYEHIVTESEIEALTMIQKFQFLNSELSNLRYRWSK